MSTITNRVLEKSTGFTHTQIKRWAVAFLKPDRTAGQHSGVERTYSFEQALMIYMGGYLVRDLKFTLKDAKQILNDLNTWIDRKGWVISRWVELRKSGEGSAYVPNFNFPWLALHIDIGHGNEKNQMFFYRAKIVSVQKKKRKHGFWQEEYAIEDFGASSPELSVSFRSIDIDVIVRKLANLIAQNY